MKNHSLTDMRLLFVQIAHSVIFLYKVHQNCIGLELPLFICWSFSVHKTGGTSIRLVKLDSSHPSCLAMVVRV